MTAGGAGGQAPPVPLLLDLLRHGEALPAAGGGDESRPLSARGARALERLAIRLSGLGWRPDRAFTSPLVRARDSARIARCVIEDAGYLGDSDDE